MAFLKTTVEELPDSQVRLEIEVPEEDVEHAIEHAAGDLANSMRIPGFRKGKVPLPVVLARVGREAVWQEAVRGHIDGWFWSAATSSGIRPVAQPEVELGDEPSDGSPFRFTATVSVMPRPDLPDWTELEVGALEPEVPQEVVDAEIDLLRSSVAELVPVDDRPVSASDTVVIDLVGDKDAQRDFVVEMDTGLLNEDVERALLGMSVGQSKEVELTLPDAAQSTVEVTVKHIKEKVLPPIDDELAKAASEFDTLAELRVDIESRLEEQLQAEIDAKFREDAVDALVDATTIDDTALEPLVSQRVAALLQGLAQSLQDRGVSVDSYLNATGQTAEQLTERLREQADRAVRRELLLDAVAEKESVEVSDEEIEELIREQATEAGDDPDAVVAAIRERDTFEQLRGDIRLKKALDEVVVGVKRIPAELAQAREKLWTPEKERAGAEMKIWTPGSEEGP